jgi:hypothetical protein
MHVQGILTLALAEAALAAPADGDVKLRAGARKAVGFILDAQYPGSVWGYTPYAVRRTAEAEPAPVELPNYGLRWAGGVEMSVVIWNGMALKAARAAGLAVADRGFAGLVRWLDDAEGRDGWYSYSGEFDGSRVAPKRDGAGRPAMAAAALMMRLWTGARPDADGPGKTAGLVMEAIEEFRAVAGAVDGRNPGRSPPDLYFLHHGSLALFQAGGEPWRRWHALMKPMVLRSQTPEGNWPRGGYASSPVMATALGALTLESYYRYSPLYR